MKTEAFQIASHSVTGKQLKSGWKIDTFEEVRLLRWKILPEPPQETVMAELILTPQQEAEAQRLAELIGQKAKQEALQMARLLVAKADHELLGATEFEIRDRVQRLGAYALETALNGRKKGGTTVPA
jgi:hypothetical protein